MNNIVNDDILSLRVNVFPNSGHHFEFLELPSSFLENHRKIKELCESDRQPWLSIPKFPWIRRRFGKKNQDQFGLWLAVESNLGDTSRGWVYEPEKNLSEKGQKVALDDAKIPPPYAFANVTTLPDNCMQEIVLEAGQEIGESFPFTLTVFWQKPMGDIIDVDLIIDFGNTRTVALALEHRQDAQGSLNAICRPIRFVARGEEYQPFNEMDESSSIIDSWFVLEESMFVDFEPKELKTDEKPRNVMYDLRWKQIREGFFGKRVHRPVAVTKRVPQMFVEMSPALLGHEASEMLANQPYFSADGNSFLSSPKRYFWDTDPVGSLAVSGAAYWTMNLNRWSLNNDMIGTPLIKLAGTVFRFLHESGKDWSFGADSNKEAPNELADAAKRPFPNPDEPCYPRADTLTWCALTILETAYSQISSSQWRAHLGHPYVPRRIRSVVVTFPAGWTGQVLELYRCKWQKAVDIFCLTHFPDRKLISNGGDRPVLEMNIDEAVASQMPYVFGEMHRLGNEGENWLALIGRGEGINANARILNVDIGGGTCDMAIVEYQDELEGPGVDLTAQLLFRDSSAISGDLMVKNIIETVLLPAIGDKLLADSKKKSHFEDTLKNQKRNQRSSWNRITRQVFIPIVRWWLTDLSENKPYEGIAPVDMVTADGPTVRPEVVGRDSTRANYDQSFNGLCEAAGLGKNLLPWDQPLHYDKKRLEKCIIESFEPLFKLLGKFVEAFDCDLVLVSGKPSELPPLKELVGRYLPLIPQRIIFTKDTHVGNWYPLSTDGTVHDAKSVTVAGAALCQAIKNGIFPGWTIKRTISPNFFQKNYWGSMPGTSKQGFGKLLLDLEQDENICKLKVEDRIGRSLLSSEARPEPVYKLMWRNRNRYKGNGKATLPTVTVKLRRVIEKPKEGSLEPTMELLELIDVIDSTSEEPVSLEDIELKFCTLDSDEYWIDAGIFNMEWSKN